MPKTPAVPKKPSISRDAADKADRGGARRGAAVGARASRKAEDKGPAPNMTPETVAAVMSAARRSGLLSGRDGRIAGRVSPELVRQAKQRTGIETDTDLIAYALAAIALEDNFADAFDDAKGTIDADLNLGV